MDFFKKNIGRIGKQSENMMVVFRPLELKVNVYDEGAEFALVFKRGPQKDPTKRYKAAAIKNGVHMQTIEFDNELFSRVSGFYREKDGRYQEKKAKVKIMSYMGSMATKICSVPFNLSDYIGRGKFKESLQLTGSAYYVEFEILIEPDTSGDPRASMAQGMDLRSTMPVVSSSTSLTSESTRSTDIQAQQPQYLQGLGQPQNWQSEAQIKTPTSLGKQESATSPFGSDKSPTPFTTTQAQLPPPTKPEPISAGPQPIIKEVVRMIENKQDQQMRFKNKDLEQRIEQTNQANIELKKIIEKLNETIDTYLTQNEAARAEKAEADQMLEKSKENEQAMKQQVAQLEKSIENYKREYERLQQAKKNKFSIDDF